MDRQPCRLAVLLALATVTATAERVPSAERCSEVGQACVNIRDCPAYQTREEVLQNRPAPCGFAGHTPLVCCDTHESVSEAPQPPLPETCGQQSHFESRFRRDASAVGRRPGRETEAVTTGPFSTQPSSVVAGPKLVHRWPWMVLFGRWTDAGLGDWFCGGALITDRHVLMSAYCLRPEEAGTVGARIADHDLTISDEVDHQERNVSRITRHPQYDKGQNDLAVVRLAAPVELTEGVHPICLPPAGADHLGQDAELAGWGRLEFGSVSDETLVLQEASLRVTDTADCEASYRRLPTFERRFPGGFQGTKVCANDRYDELHRCVADSGGPLMTLTATNTSGVLRSGVYQLVGVVSSGCGPGSTEFPGIYTKVSAYVVWIVSQLT